MWTTCSRVVDLNQRNCPIHRIHRSSGLQISFFFSHLQINAQPFNLLSPGVYLLIFKVNQDNLDDVILLTSQGVSFTEVQEGLISRRGLLN